MKMQMNFLLKQYFSALNKVFNAFSASAQASTLRTQASWSSHFAIIDSCKLLCVEQSAGCGVILVSHLWN